MSRIYISLRLFFNSDDKMSPIDSSTHSFIHVINIYYAPPLWKMRHWDEAVAGTDTAPCPKGADIIMLWYHLPSFPLPQSSISMGGS